MTSPMPTSPPDDPNWETYQAELFGAADTYKDAVREAQRAFDATMKAAYDTYHSVERAAWQAHEHAERAAKRRYTDAVRSPGRMPFAPPAMPGPAIPIDQPVNYWKAAQREATFTPNQEGSQPWPNP